jgi:hypothetical protein
MLSGRECEDAFPIIFHADDDPFMPMTIQPFDFASS